jgi:hypothetical protein
MKIIRKATFETNSSSTHSYTVCNKANVYETLYPNEDGTLTLNGGDYGWEFESYDDVYDKVSYVATLVNNHLEGLDELLASGDHDYLYRYFPDKLFENGFPRIKETIQELFEKVIKDHTGCTEIVYNTEDCYVDHQAYDGGCDILGFTYDEMKNFLFNPASTLYTGNDNDEMVWQCGRLVSRSEIDDED